MNRPIPICAESGDVAAESEIEYLKQEKRTALLALAEQRSELEHLRHMRREIKRQAATITWRSSESRVRHVISNIERKAKTAISKEAKSA